MKFLEFKIINNYLLKEKERSILINENNIAGFRESENTSKIFYCIRSNEFLKVYNSNNIESLSYLNL